MVDKGRLLYYIIVEHLPLNFFCGLRLEDGQTTQIWWRRPIIMDLRKQRQAHHKELRDKFEDRMGFA